MVSFFVVYSFMVPVDVKLVVTFPNIYSANLTCSSSSLDGGFNQTVFSRDQSRIFPDQRSGCFCLAAS